MIFLKYIYYFFKDGLVVFRNLKNDKNFLVLFPRFLSQIFKNVLIYDKRNKMFFFQKIRNEYDLITVHEIFAEESYNLTKLVIWPEIQKKYKKIISNNKKPLFIDCGSNIGSSSEYFFRIFRELFLVMIEPNLESINFSKNNVFNKNSQFFNKAISCENKKVKIDVTNVDNRASNINKLLGEEIDTITVPDLLLKYQDTVPFIIKIDIEGYEKDLFYNNYNWINNFEIIIIEIHDWMKPFEAISYNFFKAINELSKDTEKRDVIISGENLILLKK